MRMVVISKRDRSTWLAQSVTPGHSLFRVMCISTKKVARVTRAELMKFFKVLPKDLEALNDALNTVGGDTDEEDVVSGEPLRGADASDNESQGKGDTKQ